MGRPRCQCACGCQHRPGNGNRWECPICHRQCCQECIGWRRSLVWCHQCVQLPDNSDPPPPSLPSPPQPTSDMSITDEQMRLASNGESVDIQEDAGHTARAQLCIVCATRPIDTVYAVCRHMCLCQECSDSANEALLACPICKLVCRRVKIHLCGL